jgi:hypothetical protein
MGEVMAGILLTVFAVWLAVATGGQPQVSDERTVPGHPDVDVPGPSRQEPLAEPLIYVNFWCTYWCIVPLPPDRLDRRGGRSAVLPWEESA